MLPVLISLGSVKIYSMGVMLTLGVFFGLYLWWKLGRDEHLEEEDLFDVFFLAVLAFFVIGRTGYVAMHMEDIGTLFRILAFLRYPGISFVSGVVGAVLSIILYSRSKSWLVWKILDIVAVALSFVLILGAMGGLLNGTSPGREMSFGLEYQGLPGRRFPVDLLGIIVFTASHIFTRYVRNNFRFFSWYKGDAGEAKEGLAFLVFCLFGGFYYFLRGFFVSNTLYFVGVSVETIIGVVIMLISSYAVYIRADEVGRKKLFNIKLPNKLSKEKS